MYRQLYHQNRLIIFFAHLLTLPIFLPLVIYGLPSTGDGRLHLMRLTILDNHIQQGQLYPRWVPDFVFGFGYPVFNFYAPSVYALIETLHLLGMTLVESMIGSIMVITLVAGYGMYLLARDFLTTNGENSRLTALAAAIAYIYAPYFLTNLYMRGAISEAGAQALLPWILWSFRRLLYAQNPAPYLLPAAFSLGALALTHNITLLFTPPLLLGYIVLLYWQQYRAREAEPMRLFWVIGGGLAAMGISAFFWLPLIGERQYLSQYAYYVSTYLVPWHVWTWENFLDLHWIFEYTEKAPFQLGLIQLMLAVAGIVFVKKRNLEWWYFLFIAILSALGISHWAESIWLNNEFLLIAQFPWRLLSILTLPLTLFAIGILTRFMRPLHHQIAALLFIVVIIVFSHPPIGWLDTTVVPETGLYPSTITQYELDSGALGASLGREFMPRWTEDFLRTPFPTQTTMPKLDAVDLISANGYEVNLRLEASEPFPLRLTNFYFPGWQAYLDPGTANARLLELYPSTEQAIMTVDIPAGTHTVQIRWAGTMLQRGSNYISLVSLLLLTLFTILYRSISQKRRWLGLLPATFLLIGAVVLLKPAPSAQPLPESNSQEPLDGLHLLGYQAQQNEPNRLELVPYWFVETTPPDVAFRWWLTDANDTIISEHTAGPYFNTLNTSSWSAGMLIDDAYQLFLPHDLVAETYQLWLQIMPQNIQENAQGSPSQPHLVGAVNLAHNPVSSPRPTNRLDLRFGESILLDGYDLKVNGQPAPFREIASAGDFVVVEPDDFVEYTLYWRSTGSLFDNHHSFIHWLDSSREAILKQDQLPGPYLSPPVMWNPFYAQPDIYRFSVPTEITNGLYTPRVGLYDYGNGDHLPLYDTNDIHLGDAYDLPALKLFKSIPASPEHVVGARFDDFAKLLGYDLEISPEDMQVQNPFTVTLYYESLQPTSTNYTQFVHLYNAELGMAAQSDSKLRQGQNPTNAWVVGEIITDTIILNMASETVQPGIYHLQIGLYDAQTGNRAAVYGPDGAALIDRQIILTDVAIQ